MLDRSSPDDRVSGGGSNFAGSLDGVSEPFGGRSAGVHTEQHLGFGLTVFADFMLIATAVGPFVKFNSRARKHCESS
jgi:hypothetical protein